MDSMAELELRRDGYISPAERAGALAGGVLALELKHARADLRVWNRFVHGRGSSVRRYKRDPLCLCGTIGALRIALGTMGAVCDTISVARRHIELAYYRRHRKGALRHLIKLQQQSRAAIRPVTHSLGSLSVDKAVALACKAPED